MKIKILFLAFCICISSLVNAKDTTYSVSIESLYSYEMMDPTTNISRKQKLLFHNKGKYLSEGSLNIGASIITIADYQDSNRESKFGYLMRHPTSRNQIGNEVSEISIHSLQLQQSGAFTSWLAFYSEFLYSPQQIFSTGTITGVPRNQVEVSKAYILFGDKDQYPFYASFGKQDVPFGLMDTVSPFTMSALWHGFGPRAYSGVFALEASGFNLSLTAIQGGAQFRSANVPVKGTNVPSRINNFAADVNYTHKFHDNMSYMVGASYIKGSAYNQEFPITHFDPGKVHNPAWDTYVRFKLHDFTLQGEFAQTTKKWPGTHNPSPPLNVFNASKVTSFAVGGKYVVQKLIKEKDFSVSLEYSEFKFGPNGAPWKLQSQLVAGVSSMIVPNVKVFAEAIKVQGYVPFNNISGDLDKVPGTTHSDKSARTHVFLIGIQATL